MTTDEQVQALIRQNQRMEERLARLESRGPLMGVYAVKPASTNSVLDLVRIERRTTGTAADGIGAGLVLMVEDASGNIDEAASIDAVLTTAAHATEAASLNIKVLGTLALAITSAGLVTAGAGTDADGTQVLKLNIARAWAFVQRSTGASTRLQLQDLSGGKAFEVGSADGTKRAAIFYPNDTAGSNAVYLVPDGGYISIGGKIVSFGANDSAGAGYRTVVIANA